MGKGEKERIEEVARRRDTHGNAFIKTRNKSLTRFKFIGVQFKIFLVESEQTNQQKAEVLLSSLQILE